MFGFVILNFLLKAIASPLAPRTTANCTNIDADPKEECWDALKLTEFFTNKETGWRSKAPVCKATDDGSNCCNESLSWSACYIKRALGNTGFACDDISVESCPYSNLEIDSSLSLTATEKAQWWYGLKTIYQIHALFVNWWLALPYAMNEAITMNTKVISALDPVEPQHFTLSDILTGLSAGLAFLMLPGVGAALSGVAKISKDAAAALLTGLSQAPGVAKAIWPSGNEDSQDVQLEVLEETLQKASSQLQRMMNDGLHALMGDPASGSGDSTKTEETIANFVAFSAKGTFSTSNFNPSIPTNAEGLSLALKTLIVSTAFNGNGFTTMAKEMPDDTLQLSTEDLGKKWMKDFQFYDYANRRTFTMGYRSGPGGSVSRFYPERWRSLFDDGWTTPEAFFTAAYNCTDRGLGGSNWSVLNFDAQGQVDLSCMSHLVICDEYNGKFEYCREKKRGATDDDHTGWWPCSL